MPEPGKSPAPHDTGLPGKRDNPQNPATPATKTPATKTPATVVTPHDRLRSAFLRPKVTRGQLMAALLLAALGFGMAIQVRSTNATSQLRGARQSDLVGILGDVSDRAARLEQEKRELQANRDQLLSGNDQSKAALRQAEQRARTLGILAGTLPAVGPGIELTVTDPRGEVDAAVLLDMLQELRDAMAEAVQINTVRVVASSHFVDEGKGRVQLDGTSLSTPYQLRVIGDPATLSSALRIPGGVLEVLKGKGANGMVTQRQDVRVDALLRHPISPRYARPA